MKIAIVGIGGIGGFIGAKLAKRHSKEGAHSITFIQRGPHGLCINKNGLEFIGKSAEIIKPNFVKEQFESNDIYDLIIVSTKSKDLENTALSFKNNLHSKSVILTLLNGVNNAQRLACLLPNTRVLQGCIYVSAAIQKIGTVAQKGGAGSVFFGPENGPCLPVDKEIEKLFSEAEIKTILSQNINLEVWKKYLFIETFATMTSAYNKTIGEVLSHTTLLQETELLLSETLELANNKNIPLSQEHANAVIELGKKIPSDTPTSMQLDVYSGKESEIDVLVGYIIREAGIYKIQTPVHNRLYDKINSILKEQAHG